MLAQRYENLNTVLYCTFSDFIIKYKINYLGIFDMQRDAIRSITDTFHEPTTYESTRFDKFNTNSDIVSIHQRFISSKTNALSNSKLMKLISIQCDSI